VPPIQFVVDRRAAGQTLASVVKARFGLSWARAKRLVENGHVKVSGQVERDGTRRLKLGKRVEVATGTIELPPGEKGAAGGRTPPRAPAPRGPAKAPARSGSRGPAPPRRPAPALHPSVIVYVDDAVAVVNKPAGLTTVRHADEAAEFGARAGKFLPKTLADLLPAALGAPDRPVTAVHRLDRDTSGLVVFARTRAAADDLLKQFRKHTTERLYLALTRGVPPAARLESVLVRDRGDGRRGSNPDLGAEGRRESPGQGYREAGGSPSQEGKRAATRVAVREVLGNFALVECRLETGRTHQVRIHLGEAGAPLCGETVYDRPPDGRPAPDGSGAERPMLHAARLGFTHPESGEAVSWEVEPPADFRAVLARLRG
jgi:23S rRNA pseudouridine1911/1915/1917 synthase